MARYLSGLCVAGLGLCGGGWLTVAAVAFGGGGRLSRADQVNLATGVGLAFVSVVAIACWAAAWRRRMRADGVLAGRFGSVSRGEARRNRRELSRDVRRTARMARRDARAARRAERARLRGPRTAVPSAGESPAELVSQLQALLGPLLTAVEAPREPAALVPYRDWAALAGDGEEAW
jgi:hypothetical protein